MIDITLQMMTKESHYGSNGSKSHTYGKEFKPSHITVTTPIDFVEKEMELRAALENAKGVEGSNKAQTGLDSFKAKLSEYKRKFNEYFAVDEKTTKSTLSKVIGAYEIYEVYTENNKEVEVRFNGGNFKSSKFYLIFKDEMIDYIELKVYFDICQFDEICEFNNVKFVDVLSSFLSTIKKLVNDMHPSEDMAASNHNPIFHNKNKIDMTIRVDICKPAAFICAIKYGEKTIEQSQKAKDSSESDGKMVHCCINTYLKCEDSIVNISYENKVVLFVCYNYDLRSSNIIPLHIMQNDASSNPYLVSYSHLIPASASGKNYRGSKMSNYNMHYNDFGLYDSERIKLAQRSVFLKISNKELLQVPIYVHRVNDVPVVVVDLYQYTWDSIGLSRKYHLHKLRNELVKILGQFSVVIGHSQKKVKGEKDNFSVDYVRKEVRMTQMDKNSYDMLSAETVYSHLLPGMRDAFALFAIKVPYLDRDHLYNVLARISSCVNKDTSFAYFNKKDKLVVSSYFLKNDEKGMFDCSSLFNFIIRDKKWLKSLHAYRDNKLGGNVNQAIQENLLKYKVVFSEYDPFDKKEKPKYLGDVKLLNTVMNVMMMGVSRRIFMKFNEVFAYFQKKENEDTNFTILSMSGYPMLMHKHEIDGKDFYMTMTLVDLIVNHLVFDKFEYEKVGGFLNILDEVNGDKDKKTLEIVSELTYSYFMKFGFYNDKLHIADFTDLLKFIFACTEIFVNGNYEGDTCKELMKSVYNRINYISGWFDPHTTYEDCYKDFIPSYVNRVFSDLSQDVSSKTLGIGGNMMSFSSKGYSKVCSALAKFVGSVLSGLTESSDKKSENSEKFCYASMEKSFDLFYKAIEQMFVLNKESNKMLVDMVFHELKTYAILAVFVKWSLIKNDSSKKKNEIHIDKEAKNIIYENITLPVFLLQLTTGRGLCSYSVKLPGSDIKDMVSVLEYETGALDSSYKFMTWIMEYLKRRIVKDKSRDLILYSEKLDALMGVTEIDYKEYKFSNKINESINMMIEKSRRTFKSEENKIK
jgi:hypothetical protein